MDYLQNTLLQNNQYKTLFFHSMEILDSTPSRELEIRILGGRVGILRSFRGRKYINVSLIQTIQDPHEIFYHFLDVVSVDVLMRKKRERSVSPQLDLTNDGELNDAELTLIEMDVIAEPDKSSDLPPVSRSIVCFMSKQPKHHGGVSIHEISQSIEQSEETIQKTLEHLINTGLVFYTMDDQLYHLSDRL
ncbi:hypothetical protein BGY98DRAFT_960982 [Russula aff. rugulosa BPL654]|nr:hypothetical protein BGY98DRAFT_960982 [Russula aff. rugulosa BPL654]